MSTVIEQLNFLADANFRRRVEASLRTAKETGKTKLKPILFEAFDWPLSWDAYICFLNDFEHWVLQETPHAAWAEDSEHTSFQEVYDRQCHFYFLIDQPLGSNETL